jgi:hypothetical protein
MAEYSRLQMDAVLSGSMADKIAAENAWVALEAHVAEHGC